MLKDSRAGGNEVKTHHMPQLARNVLLYLILATLYVGFCPCFLTQAALAEDGTSLQAQASTVTYKDTDNKKKLEDSSVSYVIKGDGKKHKGDNHFTVPKGSGSRARGYDSHRCRW